MSDVDVTSAACAYCGDRPHDSRFELEINAWGPDRAYGWAAPSFCSRAHLVAYFAEDRLPDIVRRPNDAPHRQDWIAAAVLVAVAAFVVIGMVTAVGWIM